MHPSAVTLILAMVNHDHAIALADRRLTAGSDIETEESNKLAVFTCRDARCAVAYTGLATWADFNAHEWILESLMEAAKPDFTFEATLERLCETATSRFRRLALRPAQKRLTIVFAGFLYSSEPARGFIAYVSNFQDEVTGETTNESWRDFRKGIIHQNDLSSPFFAIRPFGTVALLQKVRSQPVIDMLQRGAPASGIRDKALSVLTAVAASMGQPGPVGRQCGSVIIPRDAETSPETAYHSAAHVWEVEFPSQVTMTGSPTDGAVMGIAIRVDSEQSNHNAIAVPKVGRNNPCPCGSGNRYKHCHGREFPHQP